VYRRKGELLVQKAGPSEPSSPALLPWGAWEKGEEAEACFRRAIAVAQGQQAKSWELRATTNLARLLRAQGRAAEGRAALAAIYGWFTEGFDTPDLIEARSLLHDLALR
jgi:predicted ATPase